MKGLIERLESGKIPPSLRKISKLENIPLDFIVKNIIEGRIVFLKNKLRDISNPCCIGKCLKPKINVNIGTSTDETSVKDEIEKLKVALKYGADTIMDLSISKNLKYVRKKILENCPVPLGTVPVYEAAIYAQHRYRDFSKFKEEELFSILEEQAKEGVDFFTIHACINKKSLKVLESSNRIMPIVSRGGAILAKWIKENDKENPFYKHFDWVLDICKKYDITISIGDSLRPGCLKDATDAPQIQELLIAGELVKKARKRKVQVMVEGPGHVPLHQVETNVILEKRICDEAPFYILGPLVLDIGCGYDHIGSAIGGALALWKGADFFCVVTPAEHLRHPTSQDIKEGTIAAKIASHAAHIARMNLIPPEDIEISRARSRRDWNLQEKFCIDKDKFKKYRKASTPSEIDVCTMCGKYCSLKIVDSCNIIK